MKLLISTRNPHKLEEIKAICANTDVELVTIDQVGDLPEVEEDGDTFEANAVKKAVSLSMITQLWTLADDSGLEVRALNGEPGVYSARYAGEPPDYQANNRKLLRALAEIDDRRAQFRCVIALAHPDGRAQIVEGCCPGAITHGERGDQGFGYDPVFIPMGLKQTFAEMDAELKNRISHRANALALAQKKWFSTEPFGF